MAINPRASLTITAFDWVPEFAQGYVRDLRPRWACEEVGLDYAERFVNVGEKPDGYLSDQPFGQVPTLRDGDIRMFESGAILLHLGGKDERLLPVDGQARADVISWLFAALNSIEPYTLEVLLLEFSIGEEWARLRRPSLVAFVEGRLERLGAALGEKDFLTGKFSIADIAMATVLREALHTELLSMPPRLRAYVERCLSRPAFARALEAQLKAFRDFESRKTKS